MTIFEGILIANLVLSLYLAYVTYKQGQDLDEITELFGMQAEISARFMKKIVKEKLDSGEWTEHETF
jgi:uncharacterized membrane protein